MKLFRRKAKRYDMDAMYDGCCHNCKWYHGYSKCHKRAPVAKLAEGKYYPIAMWPETEWTDSCGDYEESEKRRLAKTRQKVK
jgi:hypothetical protein